MARRMATLMVLCLLHAAAVSAARITAKGGTSYLGGANPAIVVASSNLAPAAGAPAAAAMAAAMASHSEVMEQFQKDMGDSAPRPAVAQQPAAAVPAPAAAGPTVLPVPAVAAPAAPKAPKPAAVAAPAAVPAPAAASAPPAAPPTFAPAPAVAAADGQMLTPQSHAEVMAQFQKDMGYPSDPVLASGAAAYRAARAAGATPEAAIAAARRQQAETQQQLQLQLLVERAAAAAADGDEEDDLPAPAASAPSSEATHAQAMAAHAQPMPLYDRQMAKLEAGLGIKVNRAPAAAAAGTWAAAPATRPRSVLAAEVDEADEGRSYEENGPAAKALRTAPGRRMLAERSIKAAGARINNGGRFSGFDVSTSIVPPDNRKDAQQRARGAVDRVQQINGGIVIVYTDGTADNVLVLMTPQGPVLVRSRSPWGYDDLEDDFEGMRQRAEAEKAAKAAGAAKPQA